jgi:very-short-patch-repair endonuclease
VIRIYPELATSPVMTTISEIMPKTRGEMEALLQEHYKTTQNFAGCESPIEEDFLHSFYKVKSEDVSIEGQVDCQTRVGRFRLDFIVRTAEGNLGFECDGKKFHDVERDRTRDEALLEAGAVDTIYRMTGKSLWFYTYDVLDLLRSQEPHIFSTHGNRLLDAILNDGLSRDDNWGRNNVVRTLIRKSIPRDDESDEVESIDDDFKSPRYVSLKWMRA